jgi:hypothetical protein
MTEEIEKVKARVLKALAEYEEAVSKAVEWYRRWKERLEEKRKRDGQ